jgi:hypothetical protein
METLVNRKEIVASAICFMLAVTMIAITVYSVIASMNEVPVFMVTTLLGLAVFFIGHALNPCILLWNAHEKQVTRHQKYIFSAASLILFSGLLMQFVL